ncbi:MAG: CPBP family intramembrane metalloprotease [Acidobacteria bacterium]|nr:CPBP family intramembrane metalloprotease [Acidobacteriota bacterium]
MEETRERDKSLRPILFPYLEALLLFALYAVGYPWFALWCHRHLPKVRGRWVVEEAVSLLLVMMLIALLNRGNFRGILHPSPRAGWVGGIPVAFQTLFLLGLLALACRVIDPAFDEREFTLRGVTSSGILAELLAMLPFGVAAEEIVFRTCQNHLRRALRPAGAILAVSLAFALYHWVPGTPLDRHQIETLLATFTGGLVLSIAYERTASLPLLIVVHLSYDILAVVQGWLNVQHLRLAEACLFLLWIAPAGLLVWRSRRAIPRGLELPAGPFRESDAPGEMGATSAMRWMASLFFGVAVPLGLSWMRTRLGF